MCTLWVDVGSTAVVRLSGDRWTPARLLRGASLNDGRAEGFEPRRTDPQAHEPTHHIENWNCGMLREVGLILLVTLVVIFCAFNFSVQGQEITRLHEQTQT